MERLMQRYQAQLDRTKTDFVRYLHDEIRWEARLNAILGARGVGKTTLMFQHILLSGEPDTSLVVFADDIYFSKHTLLDMADTFYKNGGKHLYIDEVHKYKHWSTEIKNIYDQIPDLQIVYTGSSILDLEKGGADLSRRQLKNHMHGMSFREWLQMTKGILVPKPTLDEILSAKAVFPREGYFPFCQEKDYLERLNAVVEQTLETDIPQFAGLSVGVMHKLKQLMQIISQISPFKPNYSDLARDISVARNDLKDYLFYMEKSGMIQNLQSPASGMTRLAKVEKIYLDNTNLMHALTGTQPDMGNLRETFFFNQMRVRNTVTASEISDFLVDGHTFEVGGHKKGRRQIAEVPDSYVVKDDIEYGTPGVIPLWMFGLNY